GGAGCLQPLPAFANVRSPSTLGLRGQRPSDSPLPRRGAGAVERGGLENRCARERTVGSNPTLSAIYRLYAGSSPLTQDGGCQLDPCLRSSWSKEDDSGSLHGQGDLGCRGICLVCWRN